MMTVLKDKITRKLQINKKTNTLYDLHRSDKSMNRQHLLKILSECRCLGEKKAQQDYKIPAQQHASHSPQQWQWNNPFKMEAVGKQGYYKLFLQSLLICISFINCLKVKSKFSSRSIVELQDADDTAFFANTEVAPHCILCMCACLYQGTPAVPVGLLLSSTEEHLKTPTCRLRPQLSYPLSCMVQRHGPPTPSEAHIYISLQWFGISSSAQNGAARRNNLHKVLLSMKTTSARLPESKGSREMRARPPNRLVHSPPLAQYFNVYTASVWIQNQLLWQPEGL